MFSHVCILNQAVDKKLFEVKRKDQMNALKNLIELNDVNQQYKIIDIMLKGLFKVSLNTAEKRMFAAECFLDSFKNTAVKLIGTLCSYLNCSSDSRKLIVSKFSR